MNGLQLVRGMLNMNNNVINPSAGGPPAATVPTGGPLSGVQMSVHQVIEQQEKLKLISYFFQQQAKQKVQSVSCMFKVYGRVD
jgi:hypothetical protein